MRQGGKRVLVRRAVLPNLNLPAFLINRDFPQQITTDRKLELRVAPYLARAGMMNNESRLSML